MPVLFPAAANLLQLQSWGAARWGAPLPSQWGFSLFTDRGRIKDRDTALQSRTANREPAKNGACGVRSLVSWILWQMLPVFPTTLATFAQCPLGHPGAALCLLLEVTAAALRSPTAFCLSPPFPSLPFRILLPAKTSFSTRLSLFLLYEPLEFYSKQLSAAPPLLKDSFLGDE